MMSADSPAMCMIVAWLGTQRSELVGTWSADEAAHFVPAGCM